MVVELEEFLYGDLRRRGSAVHTSDLFILVKRARTLGLFSYGVDIFDSRGYYVSTYIPTEGEFEKWYEEEAQDLAREYPDHYFDFSFSTQGQDLNASSAQA